VDAATAAGYGLRRLDKSASTVCGRECTKNPSAARACAAQSGEEQNQSKPPLPAKECEALKRET